MRRLGGTQALDFGGPEASVKLLAASRYCPRRSRFFDSPVRERLYPPSLKRIGADRMRQKVFEIGMPSGQGAIRRPAANSVSISRRGTSATANMTKRFECVDGNERRRH